MKVEVGQKIWRVKINKNAVTPDYDYECSRDGITVCEFEVIGVSNFRICVNTEWFDTFSLAPKKGERKSKHHTYLNDVKVSIRTNNNILGDGVFLKLYSTKKPTKATLRKMVAKASAEINEKYGFLFNGVKDELNLMIETFK